MANALLLSQKICKNMEKNMEKVENHFPNVIFSQGCGKLILFSKIHSSKKIIVHIQL